MVYFPTGFIFYIIIDLFFSFRGILEAPGDSFSSVQCFDVLQKGFHWLQVFVHEQGVAHAQLQLAARAAQQAEELSKAMVYLLLLDGGEVKGQSLQQLGLAAASGAQGQKGKGSRDANWGKENVLVRFLSGCLPVKLKGKGCIAWDYPLAGLERIYLKRMLLLGVSCLRLVSVVISLGQTEDVEVKHGHQEAQWEHGFHHSSEILRGQRTKGLGCWRLAVSTPRVLFFSATAFKWKSLLCPDLLFCYGSVF